MSPIDRALDALQELLYTLALPECPNWPAVLWLLIMGAGIAAMITAVVNYRR